MKDLDLSMIGLMIVLVQLMIEGGKQWLIRMLPKQSALTVDEQRMFVTSMANIARIVEISEKNHHELIKLVAELRAGK